MYSVESMGGSSRLWLYKYKNMYKAKNKGIFFYCVLLFDTLPSLFMFKKKIDLISLLFISFSRLCSFKF